MHIGFISEKQKMQYPADEPWHYRILFGNTLVPSRADYKQHRNTDLTHVMGVL